MLIKLIKNSSDTIGKRTRNLPACGAVPQPAGPMRATQEAVGEQMLGHRLLKCNSAFYSGRN